MLLAIVLARMTLQDGAVAMISGACIQDCFQTVSEVQFWSTSELVAAHQPGSSVEKYDKRLLLDRRKAFALVFISAEFSVVPICWYLIALVSQIGATGYVVHLAQ